MPTLDAESAVQYGQFLVGRQRRGRTLRRLEDASHALETFAQRERRFGAVNTEAVA